MTTTTETAPVERDTMSAQAAPSAAMTSQLCCDRPDKHGPHPFIPHALSGDNHECPGRRARHLSLILTEQPELVGVGAGTGQHQLEVMCA